MCRVDAVSQAAMYLQQNQEQSNKKKDKDNKKKKEQTFADTLQQAVVLELSKDKEEKKE